MTRLDPQALNGSNDLQLAVFGSDAHDQILLSAVFDNLGKGASGAAVQNLALMLGLDTAAGEGDVSQVAWSRPQAGTCNRPLWSNLSRPFEPVGEPCSPGPISCFAGRSSCRV